MENKMEMNELNMNEMEKTAGGVDRESTPGEGGGSLIGIIIDWLFGD